MNKLLPEVQAFVERLELPKIPTERQENLQQLIAFIQEKVDKGAPINLNFICTHNSRRSQLCQAWAQTAAFYYDLANVSCFSGGTEATAFHPNAIRALQQSGLAVEQKEAVANPVYFIRPSHEAEVSSYFSKVYDHPSNASPFAAVMTCSDAEANCPFIPEAEATFAVKYEDPKKADRTLWEAQVYADRNRQIATEMFYVFSNIKK